MRTLLVVSLVIAVALVASAAYIADQLLGVVAFTYSYLFFCLLAALAFGVAWHLCFRKYGSIFALAVLVLLAGNFFLPPPSERLLRAVMLKAAPGTEAAAVVDLVKQQYEDSPYTMPKISQDRSGGFDRIHVSLLPQKEKSCTSIIFLIEEGRVTRSFYSPD